MPKLQVYHHAFNVGMVSEQALARVDLQKLRLAAREQVNIIPKTLGAGLFRPGTEYLGSTKGDGVALLREFIFSASQSALLEFTDEVMRVWVDDELVTRPAVTSTITNGAFNSPSGWTLEEPNGGTADITGGLLKLSATVLGSSALGKQQVSTSTPNVEHALRIGVVRGPVVFRCGSTEGGDEYITETTLLTGEHSLTFTPTGSFWVQFYTRDQAERHVGSIQVESAGVMEIPTPWEEGDFISFRKDQSGDVVFVACSGQKQRRIERRSNTSWSVVEYDSNDGPLTTGKTADVRLKPSVLAGNGSLTADRSFFKPDHVGALFRLFHDNQLVRASIAAESQYSNSIRVSGVGGGRAFNIAISGTWAGNLRLQRSFDGEDFGFVDYFTYTANTSTTINDPDDNAIVYYRFGFNEGDYTSGIVNVSLTYQGGGGAGIARVVDYSSGTSVSIEVLERFRQLTYSNDWKEGEWSPLRGWPTAVTFFDGRLFWAGRDKLWGSVSDDFSSFDVEFEGDAGPILRAISTGGVNDTQWLLPLQRLIAGTDGAEASIRSSQFDAPLTPTDTTIRDASTRGCANVNPARVDSYGLFIDRSLRKLFELIYSAEGTDYTSLDLTRLNEDILAPSITQIAVQRRPDTRVWLVRSDGKAVCLVYERPEEVVAFIEVETDGEIESIAVLPGENQDKVYFSVKRTINGDAKRYIEKMAMDSEVVGGTLNKNLDCHVTGTNSPASAIITDLAHLQNKTVVVWADGKHYGEFTVDGGQVVLPEAVTDYVVGLGYEGRYESSRLAYGSAAGTAMLQNKRVDHIGLLLKDTHKAAIQYGPSFDYLDDMPLYENGAEVDADQIWDIYDKPTFEFSGRWDTDSRVCLRIKPGYPAMLLGLVVGMATHDKV